jgi:hypothetical protein
MVQSSLQASVAHGQPMHLKLGQRQRELEQEGSGSRAAQTLYVAHPMLSYAPFLRQRQQLSRRQLSLLLSAF